MRENEFKERKLGTKNFKEMKEEKLIWKQSEQKEKDDYMDYHLNGYKRIYHLDNNYPFSEIMTQK